MIHSMLSVVKQFLVYKCYEYALSSCSVGPYQLLSVYLCFCVSTDCSLQHNSHRETQLLLLTGIL